MFLLMLIGCTPTPYPQADVTGPLDDMLRMHHVQAVGTHNSYHSEEGPVRSEWAYAHLPLWQQAAEQGVRQFELDMYWIPEAQRFEVVHIPFLDSATSCALPIDCFWSQRLFSDSRPDHHPMLTLVEVKTAPPEDLDEARAQLETIEDALLTVWSRHRLITPDDVRGDAATVRDALEPDGWPVLDGLRGRSIYVLHAGSGWHDLYTDSRQDVPGNLMFTDAYGDVGLPYAAFHSVNDPVSGASRIGELVGAGHLVRTRADADSVQAVDNDTSRRDAALASGATFISTDWPSPHPDTGYVVQMPQGTPSRCNPVTAPDDCSSEAVESPP